MTYGLTSKLEAVNTMLNAIGESPVNQLGEQGPADAVMAEAILDETTKEFQAEGWHFNSHYKVDLSRDADNKIPIGTDVLRVELNAKYDKSSYDAVQRDNYLYNLAKNSDIFDQDFEDNTIIAARGFHDRTLGANTIHKISSEDEARALSVLRQAEAHTGDYNIFDSPLQAYTVNR